jgi:hypothetical protein
MALLFLGGGGLMLRESRRRLQNPKSMFQASTQEMTKDRVGLMGSTPP